MLGAVARFATDYNYRYNYDYTVNSNAQLSGGAWTAIIIVSLLSLVLVVLMVLAVWKMFVKAGRPGWAAIVPFYNSWVMAEVAGKPGWLGLVPLVGVIPFFGWIVAIIVSIIIALGLARNFGKSDAFGVFGLWLFSIIGYLILGFGSATYKGSNANVGSSSQAGSPAEPPSSLEGSSPTTGTVADGSDKPKPPTKLIQ